MSMRFIRLPFFFILLFVGFQGNAWHPNSQKIAYKTLKRLVYEEKITVSFTDFNYEENEDLDNPHYNIDILLEENELELKARKAFLQTPFDELAMKLSWFVSGFCLPGIPLSTLENVPIEVLLSFSIATVLPVGLYYTVDSSIKYFWDSIDLRQSFFNEINKFISLIVENNDEKISAQDKKTAQYVRKSEDILSPLIKNNIFLEEIARHAIEELAKNEKISFSLDLNIDFSSQPPHFSPELAKENDIYAAIDFIFPSHAYEVFNEEEISAIKNLVKNKIKKFFNIFVKKDDTRFFSFKAREQEEYNKSADILNNVLKDCKINEDLVIYHILSEGFIKLAYKIVKQAFCVLVQEENDDGVEEEYFLLDAIDEVFESYTIVIRNNENKQKSFEDKQEIYNIIGKLLSYDIQDSDKNNAEEMPKIKELLRNENIENNIQYYSEYQRKIKNILNSIVVVGKNNYLHRLAKEALMRAKNNEKEARKLINKKDIYIVDNNKLINKNNMKKKLKDHINKIMENPESVIEMELY